MEKVKTYYRRHLPHYHQEKAHYHVVFRLAGSLPAEATEQLLDQREAEDHRIENMRRGRIERWYRNRKIYFEKFDALLDGNSSGPRWLQNDSVAAIVHDAILYRNGKAYGLDASTIMPNHVHMVFEPDGRLARADHPGDTGDQDRKNQEAFSDGSGDPSYIISNIIGSLKKYTARRANKILKRRGTFWQDESYDHVIRNEKELERTIWYVLNNPVNAGLARSWEKWPWTYAKPGLL